jgi:hypothetical protein
VYSAHPTVLPWRSVHLFINVICSSERSSERPARRGSRKSKTQKIVRMSVRTPGWRCNSPWRTDSSRTNVYERPPRTGFRKLPRANVSRELPRPATSSGRGRCNMSERIRRICYYNSEQGRLESVTRPAIVVPFACYFCRINFVVVAVAINDKHCRV